VNLTAKAALVSQTGDRPSNCARKQGERPGVCVCKSTHLADKYGGDVVVAA